MRENVVLTWEKFDIKWVSTEISVKVNSALLNCRICRNLLPSQHSDEMFFFYALQETDNWTTSAMNPPGHIVSGRDHGRTATLYPREVNNFRPSWVDHVRAVLNLCAAQLPR